MLDKMPKVFEADLPSLINNTILEATSTAEKRMAGMDVNVAKPAEFVKISVKIEKNKLGVIKI